MPTAQSGPVGVADQADWLNGVTMAVEEINAAGGVNGRMLETKVVDIDLLTPEGTVAAFQSLVAVSYTHLDVYKRQGQHQGAKSFLPPCQNLALTPRPFTDLYPADVITVHVAQFCF